MSATRKLSLEEFEAMGRAGILGPDERLEFLDGEVYQMPPIGSDHAGIVDLLTELLVEVCQRQAIVRVQNPIRLPPRSMPQPDLVVLRRRSDFYRGAHPNPEDVLLVVEVSDSTLAYDRDQKLPLYAAAGIPEVWIVNLQTGGLEVHREPIGDAYRLRLLVRPGEPVAPLAFPDRPVTLP